jgi:hypothetical protein
MLNVTILACLLILTGCFGLGSSDDGVIEDAEGESTPDDEEISEGSGNVSTTVVNNYYNNTTVVNNHYHNNTTNDYHNNTTNDYQNNSTTMPPSNITMNVPLVIAPTVFVVQSEIVEPIRSYDSNGDVISYLGYDVTLYYSMLDVDGNITNAGVDINLDGNIDVAVSNSRGHVNLSIPLSEWETCWLGGEICQNSMITTVAFIAIDDDYMSTVERITFLGESPWLTNWYLQDHPDNVNESKADVGLMTLSFDGLDLDLTLLEIEITGINSTQGGDTWVCDITGDFWWYFCAGTQSGLGGDVEVWESGEIVTLTIKNGIESWCIGEYDDGGAVGCTVEVVIRYDGYVLNRENITLI